MTGFMKTTAFLFAFSAISCGQSSASRKPSVLLIGSDDHALREGDWKLVRAKDQPAELFNLAPDLAESKNLAAENPDLTAKLTATLDAWAKELAAPAFPGSSVKNEAWDPGGANQNKTPPEINAQKP